MTIEEFAKRIFGAYNDQGPNPWKTFDGRSVPTWDEISDQVRAKWCAAARESFGEVGKIREQQKALLDAMLRLQGSFRKVGGDDAKAVVSVLSDLIRLAAEQRAGDGSTG